MMPARRSVFRRIACVLALSGLAAPAAAVTLNPRGTGQVLIYPYYTVNAGFGTLLSIVNTTPHGKALKVRFHEGYNGRVVAAFNLYLSPLDVWVGEVFDTGTGGDSAAALATNDHSCVASAFLAPVDPGAGLPRINFDPAAYTGANADGGPATAARAHEGYFDVIEMGEVTNATHDSLTAISHVDGVPPGCAQIAAAWTAPAGYWTQAATIDLAPPTGGLYGAESIINVATGLMYTVNATAIDGFSSVAQHTAPNAAAPDLNTGSATAGGSYAAFVPVGAKLLEADFTKSEDAVSALFMVEDFYNEYVVSPNVGAQSDWIVSFPTKRFYTDPALLGTTIPRSPFDVPFSSSGGGTACTDARVQYWNRDELTTTSPGQCLFTCPTTLPPHGFCYSSNSVTFGSAASALGSTLLFRLFDGSFVDPASAGFVSGHARVDFMFSANDEFLTNHVLTAANGLSLRGLPALGFLAVDYVNGNVTPGVLANYSGAYPHHSRMACVKTVNPETPCD